MKFDLYDPVFRGFGVAAGATIGAALVGAGFLTSLIVGAAAFGLVAGVMTVMQSIVKDPDE